MATRMSISFESVYQSLARQTEKRQPARVKIMEALRQSGGSLSRGELAHATGLMVKTINSALTIARRKRQIVTEGYGKYMRYRLPSSEPAIPARRTAPKGSLPQ